MIKKVLLDTDVVIQLLRKDAETVSVFMDLLQTKVTLLLSPIVVAEIYAGAYPREYVDIEKLFALFECVVIDDETGRQAGFYAKQYRKSYQGISLEDFMLAASAYMNDCYLWTKNRKHYPMTNIEFFVPVV